MNCANAEPTFTLRVARDGCRLDDASGASCFTAPWVALGITTLGAAAVAIGLRVDELRQRHEELRAQLASSNEPPSFPNLIGLGHDAFWDREWQRAGPGGRAFWFGLAPSASREHWLVADAFAKESFSERWARAVVVHCLRQHAPPKRSRRRIALYCAFSDEFSDEERRVLRGAALAGWNGPIRTEEDGPLQLAAEWLALRNGWVFAIWLLLTSSAVLLDGPATLWSDVGEVSWPSGFVLSLVLLFEPARRSRMLEGRGVPWILGIVGAALMMGVVPGVVAWTNALLSRRDAIMVLAGPVTEPCPEDHSRAKCSLSLLDEGSGRSWSMDVPGPWGRELRAGQEVFFCFRRGALGEPFLWAWEDPPAQCQAEWRAWRACCADP